MARTPKASNRITTTVAPPQMAWLKAESERLGIPIGEFLRRLIDQVRAA